MKKFPCKKLIVFIFLFPLIPCLFIYGITAVLTENFPLAIICSLCIYAFETIVYLILYRNVFFRIIIDSNGIANKYVRFSWSDIPSHRIIELKIGVLPVFFKADFLCFGDVSGNSIITVDPHKTVFIALDTETLEFIRERAGKNSPF